MRSKEFVFESDLKLLYHSMTYEKAVRILINNGLEVNVEDAIPIVKDSFISFSRSPSNQYVTEFLDRAVTFEINQEKLEQALQTRQGKSPGRSYKLGPFTLGQVFDDELETRLDLEGKQPVIGLKKFVRAVHVWPTEAIQTVAKYDETGYIPDRNKDGTELTKQNYVKYIDVVRKHSQPDLELLDQVLEIAEKRGIRTHVYLNRKDFLGKRIHKSLRPNGRTLRQIFKAALAIVTRGRVR